MESDKQIRHECWAALGVALDNPERSIEIIEKVRSRLFVPELNKPIVVKSLKEGVDIMLKDFAKNSNWIENK